MKKFISSLFAAMACVCLFNSCSDNSASEPDPEPLPVEEEQNVDTWKFNSGEEVKIASAMIYEESGRVTVLFSGEKDLVTVQDFEEAADVTEICFPSSAIGTEIDLAALGANDEETYVKSRLPEFGMNDGLIVDGSASVISEGTLSSSLENGELSVKCRFTTLEKEIKFSVYLVSELLQDDPALEGSHYEFTVKSRGLSGEENLGSGFYLRYDGWTFSYTASKINSYIQFGNNNYVEIHVDAAELMDGKPFDVAETEYPFSFTFVCIDRATGELIKTMIDNDSREGASGTITLKRNTRGLYDAQFDLSLEEGDITVSGYYYDTLMPRNMAYTGGEGTVTVLNSATLDISGNPCVLYLSSQSGEAGPDRYDIKAEVPAEEWRFNYFMAFGGQDSSVTWVDGFCYNKVSIADTSFFGGNWKVTEPMDAPDGGVVAECTAMLFGSVTSYAYYYGNLHVIK
ncbi:MAG: hypothetical protein K2L14_00650 [Duncaniella sp.]|nr:hypothetical protein [Duncaniella sp.]